jgi:hypothetical protein
MTRPSRKRGGDSSGGMRWHGQPAPFDFAQDEEDREWLLPLRMQRTHPPHPELAEGRTIDLQSTADIDAPAAVS